MGLAAAAGIAAVATVGGAVISSSSQKKAAGKAADVAQSTAESNNALQQQIYNQNYATLNPFVTRGNEAGTAINSLLGLGGSAPAPAAQATQQYGQGVPAGGGYSYAGEGYNNLTPGRFRPSIDGGDDFTYRPRQALAQQVQQTAAAPASATAVTNAQTPYQNAFQNYLGSTGYQFQVDQGNQAINQGYAAKGALQSGAALKALQTYGQNTATGFFKDYLGLLSNQQGVGLSGASAIAGVGTNYANSVSANNNAAGSAQANAYLAQGNANANMWGNIAGGFTGAANLYGSSYGR